MAESSLIFISGGVRSGKSCFAEKLAADYANKQNGQLHYIAAGQASDLEMENRIEKHRHDRKKSGLHWTTWEQPVGLKKIAGNFLKTDIILLDCLTTLLNNELFSHASDLKDQAFQQQVMNSIIEGVNQIRKNACVLIIVSNEVLHEPLGSNELVLAYSKILGKLHQRIVERASQAFLIEAGIPLLMKGREPKCNG